MNTATITPPAANATIGSSERTIADAPYATSQRVRRGGRTGSHHWSALPTRAAGEPAHTCPAGTRPNTDEPGAIAAFLPMRVPGSRVLRAPIVLFAPIRTAPMRRVSPSIQ